MAGILLNSFFTIKPAQSQAVFGGPDAFETADQVSESDAIAVAAVDSPDILTGEEEQEEGRGFFILDQALANDVGSPFFSSLAANRDNVLIYTVVAGDNLSTIAEKFGIKVGTLLGANKGLTANLQIGKEMVIFPIDGVVHTVVSGDTVSGIARKYGAEAQKITEFNKLGETLAVGEKLVVPGGKLIASGSLAGSASRSAYASLPSLPDYFSIPTKGVITQNLHGHNGIDFGNARGTNVYAAAAGTVTRVNVGTYNGGYGNLVVISHNNGTQTWYAHLNDVMVFVGQAVAQNEIIAHVGNTGRSSGPHLHFEVRGARNPFARY